MRPQVAADLAEVRRRTDLHLSRRVAPPVVDRDYLVPDAPPFGEAQHAESQPTGAILGWVLAVLAGLAATAAVTWSGWAPRVAGLLR